MKLYLVRRLDNWSYDDYDSMVVAADSPEQAVLIDPGAYTFPDPAVFMLEKDWKPSRVFSGWVASPEMLEAIEIGESNSSTPMLILASFNAG